MTENYITSAGIFVSSADIFISSAGISVRQSPYIDILVLIQEALFIDSRHKEINGLLKKGVFMVIAERDIL